MSFIHWSLYSYVYATMGNTASTLTEDESAWLDYFNSNDASAYGDVQCVFDPKSVVAVPKTNADLVQMLQNKVH